MEAASTFSLPGRFREALQEGAYLTLGQDGCLYVFPHSVWERVSEEVDAASISSAEGRAYSRIFFGSAEGLAPDGQGRLTIPLRLRQAAGIEREAVVLGVRDRIEIWGKPAWDRYSEQYGGAYQSGAITPGGRHT